MAPETALGKQSGGGWRCSNVWARQMAVEGNPVRQLVVPASTFGCVSGDVGALSVQNNYGTWPAATADTPLSQNFLWARLPVGAKPGDALSRATWIAPSELARSSPDDVLETYRDAISFNEPSESYSGLRSPQLGALHAVLGYWTTKRTTPATVVMPTGTGKTETMLALLVAARLKRLLVLVPSDSLRDQIANTFEDLGVLQKLGIVKASAVRPVVGRIKRGITTAENAKQFAEACNVIVATPQALNACNTDARLALLSCCTHLFVDEAHHVAARTWSDIRRAFEGKSVVQFTATPFREDGRHLQGKMIYAFPLREAQTQGYFSQIDYTAVIDFEDVDQALAEKSVARLKSDLETGFDHVLMVRVNGVPRAKEILPYYARLAGDLKPVIINSGMPKKQQADALDALRNRESRIIVCVNMLGEGFNLPSLKVAAVHDPQKSLGVTLQFIGRFARTSSSGEYGPASMFVARTELELDKRLRALYAEDSDWNAILRDLSESAVEGQQEISDFEDGFTSLPDEITLQSLMPKLSTVVYRAPSSDWDPQNIVDYFGEENLLTPTIGLNSTAGVAWCVVERHRDVRWGDLKTIIEVAYELYVLYFDRGNRLLYINNSANDGVFEKLAEAVIGDSAARFTGSTVYRVMADIDRLVPTNVGVLDVHDQFRRFSMHVGSDVTASFSQAEAGTKSQTNISGGGYRDGEHVNISASRKGRIWSHSAATSLKEWCDWCDSIGEKLLDDTISIDKVIGQFILPQRLDGRPDGTVLAAEWPWFIHTLQAETLRLSYQNRTYYLQYADLVPDTESTNGPFRFEVKTEDWAAPYEARVEKERLRYKAIGDKEVMLLTSHGEQPLSDWLDSNGLLFILDEDRIIEDDLLYRPTWEKDPFDRSQLIPIDWTGISLTAESQKKERRAHSIQYKAIAELKLEDPPWDVVIDDDGTGEIADIVALRVDQEGLLIRLVHCKYSHGDSPGSRVEDLYEVCGQAQKSIMWRRNDLKAFFRTLEGRARQKQRRDSISPFEVGDIRTLYRIRDRSLALRRRMEMIIVQPGLSVTKASEQQLDLLASTQAYLKTTINAPLTVWCSS